MNPEHAVTLTWIAFGFMVVAVGTVVRLATR